MNLDSRDGGRAISVGNSDFRYPGTEIDPDNFCAKEILSLDRPSEVGSGEPAMRAMLREHAVPENIRGMSEWIELSSKGEWHTVALVITPELPGTSICLLRERVKSTTSRGEP